MKFWNFCDKIEKVARDSSRLALARLNPLPRRILFLLICQRVLKGGFQNARILTIRSKKILTKKGVFMALSRDKKNQLVAELSAALKDAKMTAFAEYKGLTVADLQQLRKEAREAGVQIKVVKNRLVRVAMQEVEALKESDTSVLKGQLVYAISSKDEIAAAQVLGKFAKTHPEMKLVGAFADNGDVMDTATVTTLSELPSKDQLIGQIVDTLLSPINAIAGGLTNEDLEFRKATN